MATTIQTRPVPAHELPVEPNQLPRLRSNHGGYVDPSLTGWLRPTPADMSLEEMRKRFDEDGYIWVKGLIPRKAVMDMRQHYFEHMSATGFLKPGTSPREGIFNDTLDPLAHNGVGGTDLPDDVEKVSKLVAAHSTPEYLTFLQHQSLRQFVRDFMGWDKEVMVARTLLRHNVPYGVSTGIHYDRIFLRKGEAEFLTAWVPIGNCTPEGGGLMYLEGSSVMGKKIEAEFSERAKDFTPEERIYAFNRNMMRDGQVTHNAEEFSRTETGGKMRWLVGDYEAGDVVFHNPYFIHGSARNEDKSGRIRLSTDLRFYEEGSDMDDRWMQAFKPGDGL